MPPVSLHARWAGTPCPTRAEPDLRRAGAVPDAQIEDECLQAIPTGVEAEAADRTLALIAPVPHHHRPLLPNPPAPARASRRQQHRHRQHRVQLGLKRMDPVETKHARHDGETAIDQTPHLLVVL